MMKIECTGAPFVYRWPGGEVRLAPGRPVELSPERAAKLLAKAPGRVKLVEHAESVVIDDTDAKTIYFYRGSAGAILGPARVQFVSKVGEGSAAQFWVFVTHDGLPICINSIQLRSRKKYETQVRLRPEDRIREPR